MVKKNTEKKSAVLEFCKFVRQILLKENKNSRRRTENVNCKHQITKHSIRQEQIRELKVTVVE